jgi:hypothetical protein
VRLGRAFTLDLGDVCLKTLAGGERCRLLPAFLEFDGEPVKQPATGAALEEDQRRGLAENTDAVEREEHLLVGPVVAVVLAAASGVDLDPVDAEERFDSIGVLDDRPCMTALGSLREQQVDDVRRDVGEDELDPLGR